MWFSSRLLISGPTIDNAYANLCHSLVDVYYQKEYNLNSACAAHYNHHRGGIWLFIWQYYHFLNVFTRLITEISFRCRGSNWEATAPSLAPRQATRLPWPSAQNPSTAERRTRSGWRRLRRERRSTSTQWRVNGMVSWSAGGVTME